MKCATMGGRKGCRWSVAGETPRAMSSLNSPSGHIPPSGKGRIKPRRENETRNRKRTVGKKEREAPALLDDHVGDGVSASRLADLRSAESFYRETVQGRVCSSGSGSGECYSRSVSTSSSPGRGSGLGSVSESGSPVSSRCGWRSPKDNDCVIGCDRQVVVTEGPAP